MNNDNALYWIWFSLALGPANRKTAKVYSEYGDISLFYLGKEYEWRSSGIFTDSEIRRLLNTSLSDAKHILKQCKKLGIDVISIESESYPESLRELCDPPAVLYVKGKLPDFGNVLSITMVGSRKATDYGVRTAYRFAYNLAKYGVVIISGGALGIDSASHRAALKAGGTTVCFLGCGIDHDYLRQNKKMRDEIAETGALISEYPPGTEPLPHHFPIRNRMMSAVSNGVLVIESAEVSGTLTTARAASEQGREVFAVMGNIDSPMSKGTNDLIKDGAVPVTDFRDILNYYPNLYSVSEKETDISVDEKDILAIPVKGRLPDKIGKRNVKNFTESEDIPAFHRDTELEGLALKVYEAIDAKPIHIDDLAVKVSAPPYQLLPIITELEIQGLIKNTGGRCYQLN